MTEPKTKKCEVCGETKPLEDFSKSYRNRCKPCVAEMRRKNRIVSDMTRKPKDSEYKKARIKQTGEVVEVRPLGFHAKCNIPMFRTKDCREVPQYALQFEPEIDWEQRRYEIAKSIMAVNMNDLMLVTKTPESEQSTKEVIAKIAEMSVFSANTLIDKLQKRDVQ